jgi:hypothetical protein
MDNFDLKKFLKESKALENLNPSIKAINEGEAAYEYEKGKKEGEEIEKKKMTKEAMKKHIKDMIVAELDGAAVAAEDYDPVYEGDPDDEREQAGAEGGFLDEAKKDKDEEVEDVEDVEVTDTEEEMPADEEMPTEEAPAGGLEDLAADMKGTEADLMDHLMKAFQIAKGMNNEKLETQVGNTLKFFVSEYIGGGED